MVSLIGGLVGGLVATLVMTVVMLRIGDDSPPPTAHLVATYLGTGEPDDYRRPGMALHLLYGTIAGGVFVVAAPLVPFVGLGSVGAGLLWGVVYGLLLFVCGAVFWMNLVLGMKPEPASIRRFLVVHLVYGVVLGAWVGAGILG